MSNADFTPDLSGLEKDYQILSELHQTADSRTFLARHLQLNRDVTITVIHGANANGANADGLNALARYEQDVARLTALRHPNVIPVIEGRRIADDQFAVVRARVRGSSLDQLVSAIGPIPVQRVGSILDQVRAALEWAAANGLSDRHVAQDSMIFQQGSGRVLISFEPAPGTDGLPADPCEDARTIGSLGWEMLSAQRLDDAELKSLAEMRPDLSRAIVSETNALVHCWRGGPPRDIAGYVAMLTAVAPTPPVGPTRETPGFVPVTEPKSSASAVPSTPASAAPPFVPVAMPARTLTVPRASFGRRKPASIGAGWRVNVRVMSAVAVILVLAIIGFFIFYRGRGASVDRTAVGSADVNGGAGGDIALGARPDTTSDTLSHTTSPTTSAGVASRITDSAVPPRGMVPPATRRHEPPRVEPSVKFPSTAGAPSATATSGADLCDSPVAADQRRCLATTVERNDSALNGAFNGLVTALRTRAGAAPNDSDPASVTQLRAAEREWLAERERHCGVIGTGALYARDRAQCFAGQAADRARELKRQLASASGAST